MAVRYPQVRFPRPLQFSLPKVREQSEVVWQDRICGGAWRLTLGFFLISVGLLAWQYRSLPPQVPLFYSRPWGEAQLTTPAGLMLLPGAILVVLLINGFLSGVVFVRYKLLARMLLIGAALTGFLATFSLMRIFLLVL